MGWFVAAPASLAVGWVAFTAADAIARPSGPRNAPGVALRVALRVAGEVAGQGVGCGIGLPVPGAGPAVLAVAGVALVALLVLAARRTDWRAVLAPAVLLGGGLVFALAVGGTRSGGTPPRFALFAAFLPAGMILAAAAVGWPRPAPASRSAVGAALVVLAAAFLVCAGGRTGGWYAYPYSAAYRLIRADAERGVPINLFAERHRPYSSGAFPAFWQLLKDHDHPVTRSASGPVVFATILATLAVDPADPRRAMVVPPGSRRLAGVRVRLRATASAPWARARLNTWGDAVHPWVDPGEITVVLFVDGVSDNGVIELTGPLEFVSAEGLVVAD